MVVGAPLVSGGSEREGSGWPKSVGGGGPVGGAPR